MNTIDKISLLADEFEKLAKEDPKAEVRNRGTCVFPAEHPKVTGDKDHFPINSLEEAHAALSYAGHYHSAPTWYKGTLEELKNSIHRAVKKKYPSINIAK